MYTVHNIHMEYRIHIHGHWSIHYVVHDVVYIHMCIPNSLQKRPKAEGYPDEARTLYRAVPVSEFITSDKHLTLLAECSKLEFDRPSEVFSRHPLTTDEIRCLCEDVKVLGPSELRQLVFKNC